MQFLWMPHSSRRNALLAAAAKGDEQALRKVIEGGLDKIDTVDQEGRSPLALAAASASVGCVSLLLDAGFKPEVCSTIGDTPLHAAAQRGRLEAIRLLLEARAAVDVQNQAGITPLYAASFGGHVECVAALCDAAASVIARRPDGSTPVHIACKQGHAPVLKVLLSRAPELARQTMQGGTGPLFVSAAYNRLACLRVLLGHGAEVDGSPAACPLHVACREGFVSIAQELLSRSAKPDQLNADGQSPLHAAAIGGHLECVAVLCTAGADSTLLWKGKTAKQLATGHQHDHVVALLSKEGQGVRQSSTRSMPSVGVEMHCTPAVVKHDAPLQRDGMPPAGAESGIA